MAATMPIVLGFVRIETVRRGEQPNLMGLADHVYFQAEAHARFFQILPK